MRNHLCIAFIIIMFISAVRFSRLNDDHLQGFSFSNKFHPNRCRRHISDEHCPPYPRNRFDHATIECLKMLKYHLEGTIRAIGISDKKLEKENFDKKYPHLVQF